MTTPAGWHAGTRTFTHGGWRTWLVVYGIFAVLLAGFFGAVLLADGAVAGAVVLLVAAAAVLAVVWTGRRARLTVDATGVRVVNPLGRRTVRWNRVRRFRIGSRAGIAHPVEVLLVDDRVLTALGVMEVRFPLRPSDRLEQLVDELNRIRREAASPPPPDSGGTGPETLR